LATSKTHSHLGLLVWNSFITGTVWFTCRSCPFNEDVSVLSCYTCGKSSMERPAM